MPPIAKFGSVTEEEKSSEGPLQQCGASESKRTPLALAHYAVAGGLGRDVLL